MSCNEIRDIREKLKMSREDLAALLCLSGYRTMMNIETDFRKPNKLAIRLLRYLDSLPEKKAQTLIEELLSHDPE